MCNFVSWKEDKQGNVFFLTNKDLKPRKLKEFKGYNARWRTDLCGHGAIEWFYPELKGKCDDMECEDFSDPKNFPPSIVDAIKNMELTEIGFNIGLLNEKGREEWKKVDQSAWEEYKKIKQSAYEEYKKVERPAHEKYEEVRQSAHEKYEEVRQPAWKEYEKVERPALEEYKKVERLAHEKYEEVRQPAWDKYKKVERPALEEYKKVEQSSFWDIFRDKKNRAKGWK